VLRLVALECDGRAVPVDGYRWEPGAGTGPRADMAELLAKAYRAPDKQQKPKADGRQPWWTAREEPDELAAYAYYEPRLWLVRDILQFYLAHGTFLDGEAPMHVNGFRLNKPIWQTDEQTILHAVGSFGAACNCSCKFCYEYGNILFSRKGLLSYAEADERLRQYDPRTGEGMIPVIRRYGEPTANPDFMRILRRMRETSPDELLFFITNGSMLDERTVAEMAELQPIQLSLSVNAFDPAHRKELMGFAGDRLNRVGLEAPALLERYGIRYEATFVCWPPVDFDELDRGLRYLEEHRALAVVFSFPSYSQYFPATARQFERPIFEVWDDLYAWVQEARPRFRMPILHHPMQDLVIHARVEGPITGSPAEAAGLRPDDVLLAVDGQPVEDTPTAKRLLAEAVIEDRDVSVTYRRGQDTRTVVLSHEGYDGTRDRYPYQLQGEGLIPEYHFGIHMRSGFDMDDARVAAEIIAEEQATDVLLCSSKLVVATAREAMERVAREYPFLQNVDVHFVLPEHGWWGGCFVAGDLYMVDDYEQAIRQFIEAHGRKPDLVLVPATFGNRWGVDLSGRSVHPLAHLLDVRVRLIPCARYQ